MKKFLFIVNISFFFMTGCGVRTHFLISESNSKQFELRESGCSIEMLLYEAPIDKRYDEIGMCTGSYPSYNRKAYKKVIQALKDCACNQGGNAMVYSDENDAYSYDYLGQVTHFSTSATVIYLHDTDYLHEIEVPEIDSEFDEEFDYEEE